MSLFTLRYRKPFGACEDLIEAKDLEEANQVGRAFVDREAAWRFISVRSAVVATAEILKPKEGEKPAAQKGARVGA